MQIKVRDGKGNKDRYTLLSSQNLKVLRDYFEYCRPKLWLFPGTPPSKPICNRTVQKVLKI